VAYSHTHMFATCFIACLNIKWYQFTGCDMPLRKSSWVASFGGLTGIWIFLHITVHRETNSRKPRSKLGLCSSNAIIIIIIITSIITIIIIIVII